MQVLSVTDGDTIRVSIEGRSTPIRYIGIDTPETVDPRRSVECFGKEASDANGRLVAGRVVELEKDVSEVDQFGRLLRYVYVDVPGRGSVMVNEELVRSGYAKASSYPPDVRYQDRFRALEAQARAAGAGLWGPVCAGAPTQTAGATAGSSSAASAPVSTPARSTATPPPLPTTPAPAAATTAPAAALSITRVNYDGVVSRAEPDEYVELRNGGTSAQNVAGWKLVSVVGNQVYSFPAVAIGPGQTCRVYTNEIHPEWCGLSWRSGSAIWNNSGDRANLVAPDGTIIASVGYGGS